MSEPEPFEPVAERGFATWWFMLMSMFAPEFS